MFNLRKFMLILLMTASTQGATLQCTFDGLTCPVFTLSSTTQLNEDILVPGAPFTPYSDNTTNYFNFWPSQTTQVISTFQEFPTKIFDIFMNLVHFYYESSTSTATELQTDAVHNCNSLGTFMIYGVKIGRLGAGFARTCSNIYNMEFVGTDIQSIDENALEGLSNLKMFKMKYNRLTCIPSNLFQYSKNLQTIYFTENLLTALHSQLFVGLTKLEFVYIEGNPIEYIPSFNLDTTSTDSSLTNGLLIDLSYTSIKAINPQFLFYIFSTGRAQPGPNSVNVRFNPFNYYLNQITSTPTCVDLAQVNNFAGDLYNIGKNPDGSVQNLFYQTSTTCYSSFTTDMGSDYFAGCPFILTTQSTSTMTTTESTSTTTTESSTSSTDSTSSSPANVVHCASDKICRYYLDWNNSYTCVIDGAEGSVISISGFHYLNFVDLDVKKVYFVNSFLNKVPNVLFQKFKNLKFLHISNCGLSVINDKTFNECGNLEFLDASNNGIVHVEETSLRNCTNLRIIDLTGNPLDYVSDGLYKLDPALERIHLNRLSDWTLA